MKPEREVWVVESRSGQPCFWLLSGAVLAFQYRGLAQENRRGGKGDRVVRYVPAKQPRKKRGVK